MRTFYLFKLQENYKKIVRSNPNNIYLLLKSIYTYDKKDINVAFDLFDELCLPINIDYLNKCMYDRLKKDEYYTKFKNIHMYNNYFTNEVSKMNISFSHIKIKSNKDNNIFIDNIRELTNLFVCDFMFDNYEYLNNNKIKIK